ncbi:tyrosine protein phosphatase, partial [Lactiplantibacillus plantarum]
KCGLVQVVASDAHTLKNRGFAMTKAYQVLNEMDSQYPERFASNARDLLNGEQIDTGEIVMPRKQRKHWLF